MACREAQLNISMEQKAKSVKLIEVHRKIRRNYDTVGAQDSGCFRLVVDLVPAIVPLISAKRRFRHVPLEVCPKGISRQGALHPSIKYGHERCGGNWSVNQRCSFGLTTGALSLMNDAFWREGFGSLLQHTMGVPFVRYIPVCASSRTNNVSPACCAVPASIAGTLSWAHASRLPLAPARASVSPHPCGDVRASNGDADVPRKTYTHADLRQ